VTEATKGGEYVRGEGRGRRKSPSRKTSVRREGQAGDPRFLERVQECVKQRCAILGLQAPEKFAPTTPDGQQPYQPTSTLPDEAYFAKLAAIFQELGPVHSRQYDDVSSPAADALN
jgi:hypothetical protein